jgi:hypothetical protein
MSDSKGIITLRGYGRRLPDGRHVAVCLTLNLVTQGSTQREALSRLHALIKAYVKDAIDNHELNEFVPRRAPFRFYLEYAYCYVACTVLAFKSSFCAFTDHHKIPAHAQRVAAA